ncbi:MAG: hypothetical protein KAI43_04800 [Candidatus Aureabacteria bacterium]|nr:hypothetical protein [Candidatus Auribacterota bacterium]
MVCRKKNKKKYLKRVVVRETVLTLKSISLLLVIGFFAFLYVYQNIYVLRAGYRIKTKQKKVEELEQKILNLKVIISKIESPAFVKKKINQYGLKLKPCEEESIIKINHEKT